MPTTRNRWHIESQPSGNTQKPHPDSPKKEDVLRPATTVSEQKDTANASTPAPSDSADGHGITPRSPKRRRLSTDGPGQGRTESHRSASSEAVVKGVAENTETVTELSQPTIDQSQIPDSALGQDVEEVTPGDHGKKHPASSPSPSNQTLVDNLAILSNLSSQLLSVLAKMSPAEALQLTRSQSSQNAREYQLIRSLFNPVRDLYLRNSPFLVARTLGLVGPDQIEILRKANQAMYMSSIFTGEIGLRDMDQNFLEVFVPEQGRLLKAQGSIYLELKTQAFITAHRTGAAQLLLIMAELFPQDLESRLLERRPGVAKSMAPSEVDFLNRMSSRREILLSDVRNKTVDQLHLRYRWEDLSREVSSYLAKNYGPAAPAAANSAESTKSQIFPISTSQPQSKMQGEFSIHEAPLPQGVPKAGAGQQGSSPAAAPSMLELDDFVAQAARAAEIAMQSSLPVFEPPPPQAKPPPPEPPTYSKIDAPFQHYTPTQSNGSSPKPSALSTGEDEIPHSSQTAPTRVLYEQARQATTAKASTLNRRPISPSQRRPWTPEEEAALMTGLDRVKGPHWSQILAMYGPGGTIDESLKDRNQVQLKDKARNLKLFFLKAGIEVPYYLKYVTGDLKTRAPGQMEKHETKERGRGEGEGEGHQTHFDGLGTGLSHSTAGLGEYGSPAISPIEDDELLEGEGV